MTDAMNPDQSQRMFSDIGEIKGQLNTVVTLIQQNHESMNKRVDDLGRSFDRQTEAINRRIEDHQESVNLRFESLENKIDSSRSKNLKTSSISGASAGGFVLACTEIIKALIHIGPGQGG